MNLNKSAVAHKPFPFPFLPKPLPLNGGQRRMKQTFPLNKNMLNHLFYRIHSKPINIQWIRTGSRPYEKIMSSIVLYPVFCEYKKITIIRFLAHALIVHFITAESCL